MAGSIAVETDYRHRGYSVTNEKPALTATLTYDLASGLYLDGLVIVGAADGQHGISGAQVAVGYAAALRPELSLDMGLVRTQYAGRPGDALSAQFTEGYIGVSRSRLSARAYFSPDYFRRGQHTVYLEVADGIRLAPSFSLDLHLGGLFYFTTPPNYAAKARYDWRFTLSRQIGDLNLHAGLSGRGPGGDRNGAPHGRAVLIAGVLLSF